MADTKESDELALYDLYGKYTCNFNAVSLILYLAPRLKRILTTKSLNDPAAIEIFRSNVPSVHHFSIKMSETDNSRHAFVILHDQQYKLVQTNSYGLITFGKPKSYEELTDQEVDDFLNRKLMYEDRGRKFVLVSWVVYLYVS